MKQETVSKMQSRWFERFQIERARIERQREKSK
jgi:hypothetical protein